MRTGFFLLSIVWLFSCSSAKKPVASTPVSSPAETSSVIDIARPEGYRVFLDSTEEKFQDHTGFMLYDVEKKESVYEYNSGRYFTPGSNTKIFTFYTALRLLGDSVPALEYVERNDSLIFWGTGDPSFLYQYTVDNRRVFDFLQRSTKKLYFSNSNFYTSHFGAGWAWDDYNSEFSAERSPFPIYGNLFTVDRKGSLLMVYPPFFDQFLSMGERKEKEEIIRGIYSNDFEFHPGLYQTRNRKWNIPMRVDQQLITNLLSDTLKRNVIPVNIRKPPLAQPVYSILTDSLYSVLMQDSDNFIAEQLLLMCADLVRDSLQTEIAIKYSLANYLNDLPDKPVWFDGSGLSRYNLFTPRTIVKVWQKIYDLVPREKLFALLATGGVTGTIKKWYKGETPYIFGKTGTLSNNHVLSGFLVTRSGKILIFAFMNNNYVAPTNDIRKNMEEILKNIYEHY
jgi:D-alanyl-D-alanine carboxypeptidase/D-alanyl-D-alanine-endopeptidase (penicillin-binding protein 4)